MPRKKTQPLKVFLLSGGTGRTAEHVLNSALAQFDGHALEVERRFGVRSVKAAVKIVKEVVKAKAVLFHSVVAPDVREVLTKAVKRENVPSFDILGPALTLLEDHLQSLARRAPGLSHLLQQEHFDRIDAVDFTLAHDDGLLAHELVHADVVVIGVSRVSKSVTCFYLACRGIRAANVPIVGYGEPPDELLRLDASKVVGLTMNPRRLKSLREARVALLGGGDHEQYVGQREVARELAHANAMMAEHGWHCIDVSYKSVEEVAYEVLQWIRLKKPLPTT